MAIGFSLAGTAIGSASTFWPVSLLVVALVFYFSLVSKNRFFNIFAILAAVMISYLICLAGSLAGFFPEGHAAFVDLSQVASAEWLRTDIFIPWGPPRFSVEAAGAIAAGFLCVMIESIGDYHSCAFAAGIDDPTEQQVSKGIGAEGINCAVSGLLGSVGTTSYTENIGLIGLTGVASRYVVMIGAVILIVMSFIGKLGALVATMPNPVIGGAYITLFGTIGALGIQNLMRADIGSQRNILIVGFAFLMSQGLPAWVGENQAVFTSYLGEVTGKTVWAILNTQMAVAAICAILCDSVIPGTPEERGIAPHSGE
jgi:xanthine/uracil permease